MTHPPGGGHFRPKAAQKKAGDAPKAESSFQLELRLDGDPPLIINIRGNSAGAELRLDGRAAGTGAGRK